MLVIILMFLGMSLAAVTDTAANSTDLTCTLDELNECLRSLLSVTKGKDITFATNRLQLHIVCSSLKVSIICIDNHMNQCFTPTQRKVFNQLVAGARQFLAELCVPGPLQEAYLRYAQCYKNVSVAEEKCAPKYRHLIELTENVNEERDVDEGLKESCCAFRDFVLCKYKYVSRDCGHDAAEFLERHLDRITSPLLHEHCAHYTYGDGTCSAIAKIQQPLLTVLFMLTISLLVEGILRRFWDADAING